MKKLTFFACLYLFGSAITAQSFFNNIELTAAQAYQAFDTRFFDFPKTSTLYRLKFQEGTDVQYAFGINTNIFSHESWSVYFGLGSTKEINTFRRPFDHCYFTGNSCTLILRTTDRYENDLLLAPLEIRYDFFPSNKYSIVINLQFLSSFNIHKKVLTPSRRATFEKSVSEFYSLEVNPGIGVRFLDRFSLNMHYRAWQLKNVDEVIFYGILFDNYDAPDNKFETYNPRKIWLSLRYEIFRFKKDR